MALARMASIFSRAALLPRLAGSMAITRNWARSFSLYSFADVGGIKFAHVVGGHLNQWFDSPTLIQLMHDSAILLLDRFIEVFAILQR